MTLIKYINNRMQEIALETSRAEYSVARGSEASALQAIFAMIGFFMGAVFVPVVFAKYLLTITKILKVPMPALDLLQANHKAAEMARKKKLGRSVGVNHTQQKIGGNS